MNEMQRGRIVSVNISRDKGTVKTPVPNVTLTGRGIPEDAHSGSWHRQVSLLSQEMIDSFASDVQRTIKPGEFAENITTHGIDLKDVCLLDRFRIGNAELEITQIGKECHGDSCAIFREVGACVMPKEGLFSRVVNGGEIKPDDEIVHLAGYLRFVIITLSDRISRGEGEDRSGPAIREILEPHFRGHRWRPSFEMTIIPDDADSLSGLIDNACGDSVDFIFTTGGTGIGPRDITIDVLAPMLDRKIPGVMDHIRMKFGADNPKALLSRSVAGIIGDTIVYALPGSVRAVHEYCDEILKTAEHCLFMLRGIDIHH